MTAVMALAVVILTAIDLLLLKKLEQIEHDEEKRFGFTRKTSPL